MKKITTMAALALGLMLTAAAGAAPKSDTPADTENMKVSAAYELFNAIAALALQHDELVGTGTNAKVIAKPFDFSGDMLWTLKADATALRAVLTTYEETKKSLIEQAEAKNGGPLKPAKDAEKNANGDIVKPEVQSPEQKALGDAIQKQFDAMRPVAKLVHFTKGDLCLGSKLYPNSQDCPKDAANKISPGILSALSPLTDDK